MCIKYVDYVNKTIYVDVLKCIRILDIFKIECDEVCQHLVCERYGPYWDECKASRSVRSIDQKKYDAYLEINH